MKDVKNVKKRKSNKRRRNKRIALIFLLFFAVALLCSLSLTVFFPVKNIVASGSQYYENSQIIKYSGIEAGDNLLLISEKAVLENLQKKLTFIESVTIEKSIEGGIKLTVKDAKEVFTYKYEEKYYSTDSLGRVLKIYDDIPEDIMFVECVVSLNEEQTKIIIEDVKTKEIIDVISSKVEGFSLTANKLDVTDNFHIKMTFDNRLEVDFGDVSYFEEKLAHFLKMSESKKLDGVAGSVDLSDYSPENPTAFFVKEEKKQ